MSIPHDFNIFSPSFSVKFPRKQPAFALKTAQVGALGPGLAPAAATTADRACGGGGRESHAVPARREAGCGGTGGSSFREKWLVNE